MGEGKSAASGLISQGRNIGFYAALLYGVGYILTSIGFLILTIWVLAAAGPALSSIPPERIAGLAIYIIAMIFEIIFGASILRSARIARTSEINLNVMASPVSIFATMLILYGIGSTILASSYKESLVGPICGIVGAVLLLMGFRTYQSGAASESKLMGTILMLVSLILIYFIGTPLSILKALLGGYGYPSIIPTGAFTVSYLYSEPTLEFVALLLAVICALLFALGTFSEKMQHAITGVFLSIGGLLFSVGVMYLNFKLASDISNFLGNLSSYASYLPPSLQALQTLWISVVGMILLGIGGIMALIASIIPLVSTASQLSAQIPAAAPPPPPPPPPASIKRTKA